MTSLALRNTWSPIDALNAGSCNNALRFESYGRGNERSCSNAHVTDDSTAIRA